MKIKMKDINLKSTWGTKIYIDIDVLRFTKDVDLSCVEIQIENNGEYEFLEAVEVAGTLAIANHDELKEFALKWIIKNVEFTS